MPKKAQASLFIYKSGVFDLDAVYGAIRKWYAENNFVPFEDAYKAKTKEGGFEFTNDWRAVRNITNYIRYWVNVEIKGWKVTDVEVAVKGKKVKRKKARIRLRVYSELETDWEERWSSSPILEKFRVFYEKYILKKKIEDVYEVEIWKMSYDLHSKIKQALETEAEKIG
jgi:hypothetical protein